MPGNPNPQGAPRFTKETARANALKAVESRKRNKAKRLAEAEALKNAPIEKVVAALQSVSAPTASGELGEYAAKRLMRVRLQLDQLDAMILREIDPQRLDKLASAQAKLSEQERILDGRPLPGSHRPTRAPRRAQEPTDLEPE